jgi:hypothetical protein
MVIRGDDDFNWGVLLMTKEIQISNVILTDSELKALVSHVDALEELKHSHLNHFETFNHEIDEMYEASSKTWTVQVKMR